MSCIRVESIVVLRQLPEETCIPTKEISWGGFKKKETTNSKIVRQIA